MPPGRYNNRELNPMIGVSVHVEIPRAFASTNFRKIFENTFHLRTPILIFDSYVVLIWLYYNRITNQNS